jgi:ketosteroid isomerase-like protein
MSEHNEAPLGDFLAAYNKHSIDDVMSFFTEDAVFESPSGPGPDGQRFVGKEQIRAAVAERFERSPDVHWEPEQHLVLGNKGASSWVVSWTSLDGHVTRVRGCDLFELRGGKIARKDSFFKAVETVS